MNINKNKTTKDYKKRKKIGQFFTEFKLVKELFLAKQNIKRFMELILIKKP